jgi:hypothetical protein
MSLYLAGFVSIQRRTVVEFSLWLRSRIFGWLRKHLKKNKHTILPHETSHRSSLPPFGGFCLKEIPVQLPFMFYFPLCKKAGSLLHFINRFVGPPSP